MKTCSGLTALCLAALTSLAVAQDAPPESPGVTQQTMPSVPGTVANPREDKMTSDVPTLNEADRTFITNAAFGGMFEVQSSELATTAAQDAEVKEFARKMIADHTAANNELKALAAAKHVAVPANLDVKHQKMLTKLAEQDESGFDKAYGKAQMKAHDEAVSLFEKAAAEATDPQVKAFAAKTLPTLKHHKEMASKLPGAMGGKDTDKSSDDNG